MEFATALNVRSQENKQVAKRGGRVAGNARRETEKELGESIISKQNFLGKAPDSDLKSIE